MQPTMGYMIKKLRRAQNLTQEEVAERLNVTAQAVSKWENELCMPDIALILPLARLFGVSTDVLFGAFGEDEDETVRAILDQAAAQKSAYAGYRTIRDGLRRYPCNLSLLSAALEHSVTLSYPENDCYDAEHAQEIYEESERIANLIIAYAEDASDILRARSIMVCLHASHRESAKAAAHLSHFPVRADLNQHSMAAQIAHAEGDPDRELRHRGWEFLYTYEALLDCLATGGAAYIQAGKYGEAIQTLGMAVALIDAVFTANAFSPEALPPPKHRRDSGDILEMLARACLLNRDPAQAVHWLEKLLAYNLAAADAPTESR